VFSVLCVMCWCCVVVLLCCVCVACFVLFVCVCVCVWVCLGRNEYHDCVALDYNRHLEHLHHVMPFGPTRWLCATLCVLVSYIVLQKSPGRPLAGSVVHVCPARCDVHKALPVIR
jgi:hypothetical protein